MPVINIKEIDNTVITDVATPTDNVVFVPGTAITGPSEPTLCRTYEDFVATFGNSAPSTGSFGNTWEYASNLIIAGFPVLFQRITEAGEKSAKKAQYIKTEQPVQVLIIDPESYNFEGNTGVASCEVDLATFKTLMAAQELTVPDAEVNYTFNYTDPAEPTTEYPEAGWYYVDTESEKVVLVTSAIKQDSIVYVDPEDPNAAEGDQVTFTTIMQGSGEPEELITITARYEGTFGNELSVGVISTSNYVFLQVFKGVKVKETLETIRVCKNVEGSIVDTFENFKNAIEENDGIKTDYITYSIALDLTAEQFEAYIYNQPAVMLEGGENIYDDDIITPLYKDCEPDIFSTTGPLSDKFVYDISYLTTGGVNIPDKSELSSEDNIYKKMCRLAQFRGDCIAVLDPMYTINPNDIVTEQGDSYFTNLLEDVNSSYATAFSPWMYMSVSTNTRAKWMAPSYVFLHQLAASVGSQNPVWETPAGVQRGSITEAIKPAFEIGSAILDTWQNTGVQFINPIMKLRQYGYVIFGNRTLYKFPEGKLGVHSALQELGVRMVAIEIKKAILNVAIGLTFEPNTYYTWLAFKAGLDPTLAEMKVQGGLIDYEIIMDETTTTTEDIATNTVNGIVRVNIARAAENFEIAFELAAAGVTFGSESGSEL